MANEQFARCWVADILGALGPGKLACVHADDREKRRVLFW